ncbi:hypothetical protein HYPGJ_21010 [Hyphomicrobium sp. GJ21]|nr:hypothetical protein HYPGJ_21010 [Hyphomicrobium sp. GJ21]
MPILWQENSVPKNDVMLYERPHTSRFKFTYLNSVYRWWEWIFLSKIFQTLPCSPTRSTAWNGLSSAPSAISAITSCR